MMEKVHGSYDSGAVDHEAATWLIRFDSDTPPAPGERAAFRDWLARSPAHREAIKRYAKHWRGDDVLAELVVPLPEQNSRGRTPFSGPWSFVGLGALASLVAIGIYLALTLGLFGGARMENGAMYATAIGEQRVHTLSDGSVLQLNTDTRVRVDYSDTRRTVQLLRGEAHFDVAADASRPFGVHAGDRVVTAVGTAFTVYLTDTKMKVTVTEGVVDLAAIEADVESGTEPGTAAPPENTANTGSPKPLKTLGSLKAGQSAVVSQAIEAIDNLDEPELSKRLSWRSGVLTFGGDPLSDVIAEVSRYTPITIEIVDPALRDIAIGARFSVDDLESIFDVLEANFGIQVSRVDDLHVQLRSSSGAR